MADRDEDSDRRELRVRVLRECGADGDVLEELLTCNACRLDPLRVQAAPSPPLEDEPHVGVWREYAGLPAEDGVWEELRRRLVQFRFPVEEGMSGTPAYLATVRRGEAPADGGSPGLELTRPDLLELWLHHSLGGTLPVLFTPERNDFVALVQALAGRNEPIVVPDSMGACLVSGLVNWDRVRRWREAWEESTPEGRVTGSWGEELQRLAARKELIQDRLVVLSGGPYSNVPAEALGMGRQEWLDLSLLIRREHESTHYFTLRLFGTLQHNVLEEIAADLAGLVRATGEYDPELALRLLGLEDHPRFRPGGRLANYRGRPPISDRAFAVLQELTVRAVRALASVVREQPGLIDQEVGLAQFVAAVVPLTLEELASPALPALLEHLLFPGPEN